MSITYFIRSVYGKPTIYLLDGADSVSVLTRRKTVEQRDIDALKSLGLNIQRVEDPSLAAQ